MLLVTSIKGVKSLAILMIDTSVVFPKLEIVELNNLAILIIDVVGVLLAVAIVGVRKVLTATLIALVFVAFDIVATLRTI